ncbi:hypothetical protein GWK47_040482 [Chionoecetes opilio]|uniref:Uncharacterized protein n=1 Tax=Chionoecetes opilio TaxID=41210 RepID=A0A8J4YAN7_CHIOP|nr:hypothetical protein GWK47_040482 [Chionoecetes opilio]
MPDDDNLPTTATLRPRANTQLALLTQWYPSSRQRSLLSRGKSRTTNNTVIHNPSNASTVHAHPHLSNASTVHAHPHLNAASNAFRSRSSGLCWYHNYFAAKPQSATPPPLVRGIKRKRRVLVQRTSRQTSTLPRPRSHPASTLPWR